MAGSDFEIGQLLGKLHEGVDNLNENLAKFSDALAEHKDTDLAHQSEMAKITTSIRGDLAQVLTRVEAIERVLTPALPPAPEYPALPAHEPSDPNLRRREPSNPNLQRVSGPHPVIADAPHAEDVLNIKADGTTTVRMAKVSDFVKKNLPTIKWIIIILLGGAAAFGDKAKALLALLRGP